MLFRLLGSVLEGEAAIDLEELTRDVV